MPSYAAIVPNFNDRASVGRALTSLFEQTRPFDQVVVVDDGSTDDSVAVIGSLIAGRSEVRFIRLERNQGVVAALNAGIDACGADFLLLCSANDTYHERLVEWCDEGLKRHPEAGMVTGQVRLAYASGDAGPPAREVERVLSLAPRMRFYSPQELILEQRRVPIHFNGGASMLRTHRVKHHGGLLPAMAWHCDWLMYNLIAFDDGIVYVPETFATLSMQDGNCYSSSINVWHRERPVIENMLRILPASYPRLAPCFRRAALLPIFHLRNPFMLLRKDLSWIVTPLLLWRVAVHRLFYWLKFVLPRPFMMRVRALIGV